MDKLRKLREYWDAYRPTQLRTSRLAREWMEAGIAVETATRWASAGFLPDEALPLITSGVSLEMATAMDPTTEQEAIERLADLIQLGALDDTRRQGGIQ